jgi:hypothetical protein
MKLNLLFYVCAFAILCTACGSKTTPTAVPTALPSATFTPQPTLTPTATPTPQPTPTPLPSATFTSQPTATQPSPTPTTNASALFPDTHTPLLVGQWGGVSRAIAYQDRYAYLGVGLRMLILDISQPDAPQVVGQTDILPDVITGITVVDHLAYVVGGKIDGLLIFNVSDPSAPVQVGFCPLAAYSSKVVVVGDFAYVLHMNGLYIIDIYNPANPVEIDHYFEPYLQFVDLAVAGDYVFLATDNTDVYYLDISKHSFSGPPHAYEAPYLVSGLVVAGNKLYILCQNQLVVVDISNLNVPMKEIGSYQLPSQDWDALNWIVYRDGTIYLAGEFLLVIDASDPSALQLISRLEESGEGIASGPQHVFLARFEGGLTSVSLANPRALVKAGEYIARLGSPGAVAGQASLLLISDWGGLYSLDVTDPANPTLLSVYRKPDVEPWINAIAISGHYAYLAYPNVGLSILDLADPNTLQEVGHLPGAAMALALEGTSAYVVDWQSLYIVDVSDPAAPRKLGTCSLPSDPSNGANGVAVAGAYAFVTSGELGLHILDISDPHAPQLIQTLTPGGYLNGIMLRDGQIYLPDRQGRVRVLDVRDPLNPREIIYAEPGDSLPRTVGNLVLQGSQVTVAGQFAYVLTRDQGLLVFYLGKQIN